MVDSLEFSSAPTGFLPRLGPLETVAHFFVYWVLTWVLFYDLVRIVATKARGHTMTNKPEQSKPQDAKEIMDRLLREAFARRQS